MSKEKKIKMIAASSYFSEKGLSFKKEYVDKILEVTPTGKVSVQKSYKFTRDVLDAFVSDNSDIIKQIKPRAKPAKKLLWISYAYNDDESIKGISVNLSAVEPQPLSIDFSPQEIKLREVEPDAMFKALTTIIIELGEDKVVIEKERVVTTNNFAIETVLTIVA